MGRCLLGCAGGACGDEPGVLRGGAAGGAACLVHQPLPERALRHLDAEQECWTLPGEERREGRGPSWEVTMEGMLVVPTMRGEDYGASHGAVATVLLVEGCP